ncbi:MAG TPA: prepilin-type N-terminal cleavage/methylation domain-containing protein [Verrucomicrobiae bacterium]|nr:prepilin-type N-terminal cleavage/methylation domain-containing protein [Verrucomicrobiae bacterium]
MKVFRQKPNDEGQRFCRRAFTLIEIMVALMLFMLVVAAVYSTWFLLLKASAIGQEAAARAQSERIAVRTLEDSLTCIQSFQASMKYYAFAVTNGDDASLSFTARLPDIFPRNGRFGGFNLRRLTFGVETGPDSQKDLVLRQNPILMDMDSIEKNNPLVLAHDVKAFTIECWDTNQQDWATEWNDTNSIPPAIRVTLSLGGNGGPPVAITRLITVPSSTVPVQVQQPMLGGPGNNPGIKLPVPTH